MNPNLNADESDSLLQQYESENLEQDREFLVLIRRVSSALHQRAQRLGIEIPFGPADQGTAPYHGSVMQLALAFMDFKLTVFGRFPELSPKFKAAMTMANTMFAWALDFNFLSSPGRGNIIRTKDTMTATELQNYIGERLAEHRQKQGLTQKELGDKIGMSNASIGRIEAGKQRLGMFTLYALLENLNLPVGDVLPQEAQPGPPFTLEQIEEIEEAWPKFQREVLGRWKEELRQQKNKPSKRKI